MWKTINKLSNKTSHKTTNITEVNQNGSRITDDTTITNTPNKFNEIYVLSLFPIYHEVKNPPSRMYVVPCESQFQIQNTHPRFSSLFKTFQKSKISLSTGHDGIPSKLSKNAASRCPKNISSKLWRTPISAI